MKIFREDIVQQVRQHARILIPNNPVSAAAVPFSANPNWTRVRLSAIFVVMALQCNGRVIIIIPSRGSSHHEEVK